MVLETRDKMIKATKAAKMMGVHYRTVHKWCRDALSGNPTKLYGVMKTPSGRYMVSLEEVEELVDAGMPIVRGSHGKDQVREVYCVTCKDYTENFGTDTYGYVCCGCGTRQ